MDERINDAIEMDEVYELRMCDRSGDNRQMFQEAEERSILKQQYVIAWALSYK